MKKLFLLLSLFAAISNPILQAVAEEEEEEEEELGVGEGAAIGAGAAVGLAGLLVLLDNRNKKRKKVKELKEELVALQLLAEGANNDYDIYKARTFAESLDTMRGNSLEKLDHAIRNEKSKMKEGEIKLTEDQVTQLSSDLERRYEPQNKKQLPQQQLEDILRLKHIYAEIEKLQDQKDQGGAIARGLKSTNNDIRDSDKWYYNTRANLQDDIRRTHIPTSTRKMSQPESVSKLTSPRKVSKETTHR